MRTKPLKKKMENQKSIDALVIMIYFFIGLFIGFLLFAIIVNAQEFTLDKQEATIESVTGSFGVEKLTITNVLNQSLNITVNTSLEGRKFLFFEDSIEIPANSSEKFNIGYFIPPIIPPQTYELNLSFASFNQTETFKIMLDVRDNIPPILERCTVEPKIQNISKYVSIWCKGYDIQSNISEIIATVSQFNSTEDIALLQVGKEEYSGNFTSLQLGKYNVTVTAVDASNNSASYDSLQFELVDWTPLVVSNVNFGRIKSSQYHQRVIGSAMENVQVLVTLEKLEFLSNITEMPTADIVLSNGKTERLLSNQTLDIFVPKGDIGIRLFSNAMSEISGVIRFDVLGKSLWSEIRGNVSWYSVPPSSNTTWMGNPSYCYPSDTGAYETSRVICELELPIDTRIGTEFGILPASILETYNPSIIIELEKKTYSLSIQRWVFLSFMLVFMFAGIGYFVYQNW